MSRIFYEVGPFPLLPEFYPGRSDGRVYIKFAKAGGREGRTTVGKLTEDGLMYPNAYLKYQRPDLWEKLTGEKAVPYELGIGLYLVYLSIGISTGLYELLARNFGVKFANATMDYCMGNAVERSDATYLVSETMKRLLTFSAKPRGDKWYSIAFANMDPAAILKFKQDWVKKQSESDNKGAWLCIDASNTDCNLVDSGLCERGHSKSGKNLPVVGYIWAVKAKDGMPVSWHVNPGSMVDFKAVDDTVKFLAANGMKALGLIFDRGFCSEKVYSEAREKDYDYVAMLKENTTGFQEMYKKHSKEIVRNFRKKIPGIGVFGTTDTMKVFANSTEENCIGLYWDCLNGDERALSLADKIETLVGNLTKRMEDGKDPGKIEGELNKFVSIVEEDGKKKVEIDFDAVQGEMDEKGFSAIASTLKIEAGELRRIYYLRDGSEKDYSSLKSQLGFDAMTVHTDPAMQTKFMVAFVSSILRNQFERTCKSLGIPTNKAVRKLNEVVLHMGEKNRYDAIHNVSKKILKLLSRFGITSAALDALADEVNAGRINDAVRKLPETKEPPTERRGRGRPAKPKVEKPEVPKKPRGRPKGSKNKKTLAKLAAMAAHPEPQQIKRKPGRPKGSKNKSTLQKEAEAAKPKRGRPKGSKNKTPEEREALRNAPRRPRGRPRKNPVAVAAKTDYPVRLLTYAGEISKPTPPSSSETELKAAIKLAPSSACDNELAPDQKQARKANDNETRTDEKLAINANDKKAASVQNPVEMTSTKIDRDKVDEDKDNSCRIEEPDTS